MWMPSDKYWKQVAESLAAPPPYNFWIGEGLMVLPIWTYMSLTITLQSLPIGFIIMVSLNVFANRQALMLCQTTITLVKSLTLQTSLLLTLFKSFNWFQQREIQFLRYLISIPVCRHILSCTPAIVEPIFSMCYELHFAWHRVFIVPHLHLCRSMISGMGGPFFLGAWGSMQIWTKRMGHLWFFRHQYHDWMASGTQIGAQTYWRLYVLDVQTWYWRWRWSVEHWWRHVRLVHHILKVTTQANRTWDWPISSWARHVHDKSYRPDRFLLVLEIDCHYTLVCTGFLLNVLLSLSVSIHTTSIYLYT